VEERGLWGETRMPFDRRGKQEGPFSPLVQKGVRGRMRCGYSRNTLSFDVMKRRRGIGFLRLLYIAPPGTESGVFLGAYKEGRRL